MTATTPSAKAATFLDYGKLKELAARSEPAYERVEAILAKARLMRGLTSEEAADLAAIRDERALSLLLETAGWIKREIYGRRMVIFAPVYTGNYCVNNCVYCGFRASNRNLRRVVLSRAEIENQAKLLLAQGHKRILLICGESPRTDLAFTLDSIAACYGVSVNGARIRRINVELAPMEVDAFRALKAAQIGTYVCFQETYDPELYAAAHPSGPKADYRNRLYVMDRAMEGGCDDVGLGALFGLGDWRYELAGMLEHARHLEEAFGCGPHTVSVPRIEYASGAPAAEVVPNPVSDDDFKKIVAILRVTLPYVGIILSTRERTSFRKELMAYGVSQISAGSRTDPGGYDESGRDEAAEQDAPGAGSSGQFALGDTRNLEETISDLIDDGYVPSFCTGCYRRGRTGADFMDLAKPGLIKEFCLPNGLVSFSEYLHDYASAGTRERGLSLIESMKADATEKARPYLDKALADTAAGKRDLYL